MITLPDLLRKTLKLKTSKQIRLSNKQSQQEFSKLCNLNDRFAICLVFNLPNMSDTIYYL